MDKDKLNKYRKYFEHYIAQRKEDFRNQYNHEQSWENIQCLLRKRRRQRISLYCTAASAAVLLLIIGFGNIVNYPNPSENTGHVASVSAVSFPENGRSKATLTLDNGETVDLSVQNGEILNEGLAVANNASSQLLTYKKPEEALPVARYNTLFVPRGGEYQLILSDGTKIWMNAESTLRYPTSFAGPKREVRLEGEAFFEVAKDAEHPFVVKTGHQQVEVLGTSFNVSAYPGNKVYTTLAEGSVKVDTETESVVLKPNQQAIIDAHSDNITMRDVPAHLYTSWTKGNYEFRNTPLEDIAAQLSRWYDVDICFKDKSLKDKRFAGIIFRHEELGFAVDVIEEVSNVRFNREGNTIYIEDGNNNEREQTFKQQ